MKADLDEEQATQVARYLLGVGWYAVEFAYKTTLDGSKVLGRDGIGILYGAETWRDVFHLAGEDLPERGKFVEVGMQVVRGEESVATCRSRTMAARIAAALNWYKPTRRGY